MSCARIVICSCSKARILPDHEIAEILDTLRSGGTEPLLVPDLCGCSARRDPLLMEIAATASTIVACYPRAVKWLFAAGGAPVTERTQILNIRIQPAKEVISKLGPGEFSRENSVVPPVEQGAADAISSPPFETKRVEERMDWNPWFPVIDFDRCTHCMQCLSFCLFGVYGLDERKRIAVLDPESCKPNCPACSRVCPQLAIMFPKHNTGPINGEEITAPDIQRTKAKVNVSAMLGGDLYSTLRQRSEGAKTRFSKERNPEQALLERQHWLAKMAAAGEIPPEVLASLPSPDELQRRARAAAEKAKAALGDKARGSDAPNSQNLPPAR